jgi:hypothetical protein
MQELSFLDKMLGVSTTQNKGIVVGRNHSMIPDSNQVSFQNKALLQKPNSLIEKVTVLGV